MYASDLKHNNRTLEDKLHMLYGLSGGAKIELGFRPAYLALLEKLGNPHLKLPPVIHVAGTNGKGSTIAFMRSVLESAGYSVHSYTSPHLIRFNERIVLAGKDIDDVLLESLIDDVLALNNGEELTFFEITTAIAFTAFAKVPADFLLLEVGLGGRLDCTNVIEDPAVTVITDISKDHTEFLGETPAEIAAEKAGIIKPGAPCVTGPQKKDVLSVIEATAKEKSADFVSCETIEPDMELGLTGFHQKENAALAVSALKALERKTGRTIPAGAIKTGLAHAHWPGRLQKLPLEMPEGWEIWLDGGHNESAGQALAAQAQEWGQQNPKPLHLIAGMMAHKNPDTFLAPLLPHLNSLWAMDIPDEPHSLPAENLINAALRLQPSISAQKAKNPEQACRVIAEKNQSPGRILIAGSLYLAGHVLHNLQIPAHNET